MCVFNSAVPRLDTASIETMMAFQFDSTSLLLLSIQVNIGHVYTFGLSLFLHSLCVDYYLVCSYCMLLIKSLCYVQSNTANRFERFSLLNS